MMSQIIMHLCTNFRCSDQFVYNVVCTLNIESHLINAKQRLKKLYVLVLCIVYALEFFFYIIITALFIMDLLRVNRYHI